MIKMTLDANDAMRHPNIVSTKMNSKSFYSLAPYDHSIRIESRYAFESIYQYIGSSEPDAKDGAIPASPD